MGHDKDTDAIRPPAPPDAETAGEEERLTTFSRRELLRAGWTAPVILAVALPESAYALSSGHADVHVDSHIDVQQFLFNDFNPADPDEVPEPELNQHQDVHTDTHTDEPISPAHADVGHQDGHTDVHIDEPVEVHQDVEHADGPPMTNFETHVDTHTDVHNDGVATPPAPIHVDAHEDSHTDAHVDSHVDHSDAPAHTDSRHTDHSDVAAIVFHYDFSCGPTHQDQVHVDAAGHVDHGDQFHRDLGGPPHTDHFDLASPGPTKTVHCDGPVFLDHTDKPKHSDAHTDSHGDKPPHNDTSHGDSHTDTHTDVPHADVHVDQ